jgi:phage gp36-like protein
MVAAKNLKTLINLKNTMAFLTADDYKELIQDDILQSVIESNDALRISAELKAEAEMTSYLNVRFDVPNIFNKEEAARNASVVMFMVDIVLYHLHSRINPGQIPQLRIDRYNEAKRWLEMVASGKLLPSLPVPDVQPDGYNDKAVIQFGGLEPRNPYY